MKTYHFPAIIYEDDIEEFSSRILGVVDEIAPFEKCEIELDEYSKEGKVIPNAIHMLLRRLNRDDCPCYLIGVETNDERKRVVLQVRGRLNMEGVRYILEAGMPR